MVRFVFIIIVGIFTYSSASSQTNCHIVGEGTKDLINIQLPALCLSDSCKSELLLIQDKLHSKGFLEASYKYEEVTDTSCVIVFHQGPLYTIGNFNYKNLPEELIKILKSKLVKGQIFNQAKLEESFKECLEWSKNRGYHLTTIFLDSIKLNGSVVTGTFIYKAGFPIITDSLHFHRIKKNSPSWLKGYIGWKKGLTFTPALKNQFLQRLYRTGYYTEANIINETIYGNHVDVELEMIDRMSDRFEGILGYSGMENQRYLVGQTDIFLSNLFSSGIETEIFWQKLKPQSSKMDAHIKWLGAFNFPLEFEVGIKLLKEDTLFFNKSSNLIATFLKGSNTYLSLLVEFNSGSMLYALRVDPISEFQPGDFSIDYYGFQVGNKRFAKDQVKREWIVKFSMGNKIYEDLNQPFQSTNELIQWKGTGNIVNNFEIKKNWVISTGVNIGVIKSNYLFYNDLFMIGGLKSFRGFNENQFFTSQYYISQLELRYNLISGGYFLYFIDGGIMKSIEGPNNFFSAMGTGSGIVMPVKQGIFQLIFALGYRQSEKSSLRDSKIHFGYVIKF